MPYKDPDQQREYQRRWMAERRRQWLAEHGPCVDCRTWDELQVDHEYAATKVNHRVWSWSESRRQEELAKCVARCNPCHKKKSAGEKLHGEQQSQAKLNEELVREIRASTEPCRVIGAKYGVAARTISRVRTRVDWKHVM